MPEKKNKKTTSTAIFFLQCSDHETIAESLLDLKSPYLLRLFCAPGIKYKHSNVHQQSKEIKISSNLSIMNQL